jgi:hypothetical protein
MLGVFERSLDPCEGRMWRKKKQLSDRNMNGGVHSYNIEPLTGGGIPDDPRFASGPFSIIE